MWLLLTPSRFSNFTYIIRKITKMIRTSKFITLHWGTDKVITHRLIYLSFSNVIGAIKSNVLTNTYPLLKDYWESDIYSGHKLKTQALISKFSYNTHIIYIMSTYITITYFKVNNHCLNSHSSTHGKVVSK